MIRRVTMRSLIYTCTLTMFGGIGVSGLQAQVPSAGSSDPAPLPQAEPVPSPIPDTGAGSSNMNYPPIVDGEHGYPHSNGYGAQAAPQYGSQPPHYAGGAPGYDAAPNYGQATYGGGCASGQCQSSCSHCAGGGCQQCAQRPQQSRGLLNRIAKGKFDGQCHRCGRELSPVNLGLGKSGCQSCVGGTCDPVPSLREVVCGDGAGGAYCRDRVYGRPELFYNYYAPPGCAQASAEMYMSPRPVPELVGHTYYTYQPLMPHEWMYPHHRTYHRYYDGGRGLTRTKVVWWSSPINAIGEGLVQMVKIPR